jgi:retron-type reverse transcriptase
MARILSEKIHDNRFLRLIRNMLKAGYLEDWKYHDTLSGAPQGGVVSPVLSNIYLSKLDTFAETVLIPQYNRGDRRKVNPEYRKVHYRLTRARREGDRARPVSEEVAVDLLADHVRAAGPQDAAPVRAGRS